MASNPIIDYLAGNAQTTGTGAITAITITPPANDLSIHVRASASGKSATDGDAASYEVAGTFENTSGTMAQVSTDTAIHTAEENTSWVGLTLGVSGNTVLVQVAGVAANTIDWSASAEVTYHQP